MFAGRIDQSRHSSHALLALIILSIIVCLQRTHAEQLPVKNYTIADGLARDYVNRIKQDSHGFIWFCTNEGISRFDGYGFTNYGVADGLPDRIVNDVLETRDGYLFATNLGLVEFNPATGDSNGSHFTAVTLDEDERLRGARRLIADATGAVWCGSASGLYRLDRGTDGWESTRIRPISRQVEFAEMVNALAFDRRGILWVGTNNGLYRLFPDRTLEHYTVQNGLSSDGISQVLVDRDEKVWVGTSAGLTLLISDPRPNQIIAARVYSINDGLLYNFISALFQSSDGRLWVGTRGGLNFLVDPRDNNGSSFRGYTTAQGLRNVKIWDITEDRDHNLWLGAESGGAMKIPHAGFTSYFESDGLGNGRISQLFTGHDGKVYVVADGVANLVPVIARFDGHGFVRETPNLPPKTELTWGWNNLILQDSQGDWWIPTAQGIYRYSGNHSFSELATTKPTRVYTVKDGMNDNTVFRLFEDARGDLWFTTLGDAFRTLHRWERQSDKIYVYTPQENDIPAAGATAFANDHAGNLWIGFYTGGVCRYADGHFTQFLQKDGVPPGFVRDIRVDSKKRLWIATNGGLSRVDNPVADRPQFRNYTAAEGLATSQVTCVTEDRWGQIYLGTGRGLDRLDPDSGKIKHYTTADGLGDNFINVSMCDSQGALWFGTYRGLSRFIAEQDKPLAAPPIIISGLRVADARQTISELGETEVTIPELSYRQNQVRIDFLSISYAPGDVLRYQFKLEGSRTDWSSPSDARTITLANLPAGRYRFLVRAVNSDGAVSLQPASVTFKILPPFWLRWWFVSLGAMLVAAVLYSFYRLRTARLREVNAALAETQRAEEALGRSRTERLAELERVRGRIATDLHDDIGSSLTQIAILSEVAHQQAGGGGDGANGSDPITRIISVSNELVDTMSDIVWAINPKRDHLSDLLHRMRRFASDVFTARHIAFQFRAPDSDRDIELGANVRREVFLIFKESVNNVVKHSGCTRTEIEFQIEGDWLVLKVCDDGKGFDSKVALDDGAPVITSARGGNGLPSMRKRAQEMGGQFEIVSGVGKGTTATLRVLVAPQQAETR